MAVTFNGGIHINDHKTKTNSLPITIVDGSKEHVFLLQQHIGAPISPIVKVGDKVYVGQKIADTDAFVSVPLHSSISGVVTAIEPRLHPTGVMSSAIVVENDYKYTPYPDIRPKGDIKSLTPGEIIKIVREAGIVGMGGAGFPTHVKLSPPKDKKIDYVIINGAECEPYLTSDHRVMLEYPSMIIYGLRAVMKVFGLERGYIGIESNKPDAIELLKSKDFKSIEVIELKTKYPQGSEKQLIRAVTHREVPSGGLPADVGVVVLNIDTVVAIATAIKTGMPLIRRIVTISGDAIKEPKNLEVRIGMSLKDIFEHAGGFAHEPRKIIMGGPMMGLAQYSLDSSATKGTSALLALTLADEVFDEDLACIRCGKCVKACPMGLMPLYLNMYAKKRDWDMCEKYHITDCMECGVCSYLCPGRQHPLQNIRMAKQKVMEIIRNRKKPAAKA